MTPAVETAFTKNAKPAYAGWGGVHWGNPSSCNRRLKPRLPKTQNPPTRVGEMRIGGIRHYATGGWNRVYQKRKTRLRGLGRCVPWIHGGGFRVFVKREL